MKRFVSILILVLLNGAFCLAQSQNIKRDVVQEVKTLQAEKAATRFLRRFNETKNFAIVYREFFVQDKSLRLRAAKPYLEMLIDKKLLERLSDETRERFYISFLENAYLTFFYVLNRKDYGSEKEYLALLSLWFSVMSQMSEKFEDDRAIKLILLSFIHLDCNNRKDLFLETKEQVESYITLINLFAHQVRRQIPTNPVFTKRYKKNVTDIVFNGRKTYIEDGDEELGISKDKRIYTISRGVFLLVWMEESGRFKIIESVLFN